MAVVKWWPQNRGLLSTALNGDVVGTKVSGRTITTVTFVGCTTCLYCTLQSWIWQPLGLVLFKTNYCEMDFLFHRRASALYMTTLLTT